MVVELDVMPCDGSRVLHESRVSLKLFELSAWPGDCSVPTVDAVLQFTSLVRCWQRRTNSPVLVFGTARPSVLRRDRSRAAVFTALWRLMEQAELDSVVDVFAATRLTCLLLPSALINEVSPVHTADADETVELSRVGCVNAYPSAVVTHFTVSCAVGDK